MAYYPGATTGGGAPGSEFYPMSLMDYTPPEAMEGVGLEYQPWLQPENMPDSLWNYQAPTLDEWSTTPRNWDWALNGAKKEEETTEEEEEVDEAPITDVDNIEKIKRVKADFLKGKKEGTAESVLNKLYGIDSGIWATKERMLANKPWVNPASVIADEANPLSNREFIPQPGSTTPWRNPDYVSTAPATTAAVTPMITPTVDFATQQQRLIDASRARYNRNAPGARSRTNLSWT